MLNSLRGGVASWSGDPEQGSFTLKARYAPPPNDNFADAETISGDSTSVSGDNIGASTEAGETVTGFQSSRSVWYRWTAPDTGLATLNTCLSDFDTVLSVHTGSVLSSLAQVTSNDQGCGFGNNGSQVFFDATEDTVYYIRVASFGGSVNVQGNFILNLGLADNVAPDTTITGGPNGLTADDTPTFSFSGTDNKSATENLRYAHAVDGVWSPEFLSDTSVTLASLPDGPHTFHVQALDEADNADGTPAERTFTVETEAPSVETVSPEGAGAPRLDDLTATFSEPMKPAR